MVVSMGEAAEMEDHTRQNAQRKEKRRSAVPAERREMLYSG